MALSLTLPAGSPDAAREASYPQRFIEQAFPVGIGGDAACTQRMEFARREVHHGGSGDTLPLKRGILAGALAEQEMLTFARGGSFSSDLGSAADTLINRLHLKDGLPTDQVPAMRDTSVAWVRAYLARFPPEDDALDWMEVEAILPNQTPLYIRRPGRFRISVRPDLVVGVGDALVCIEYTTARRDTLSPARAALNYWAIARERHRRPEWGRFTRVLTRVERFADGSGYSLALDPANAERWRVNIGAVADALIAGEFAPNVGEHCALCPWEIPCRVGSGEEDDGEPF